MDSVLKEIEKHTGNVFHEVMTGQSYEGRQIHVLRCGTGRTKVLAWSQMHGNEPTSTLALLDAMQMLSDGGREAEEILSAVTWTVIPLLNPDGATRHDRRNAQGIDINRDAQSLTSPEARLLMSVWEDTKPDFALNLHDQETRYASINPPVQSLLAMLAPECSHDKRITPARERAMKVIAGTASRLSGITDGRIAKYDDVYTPTAFGDTFMQKGTSSILIEAGTEPGDPKRDRPRAAMAKAIVTALSLMASGSYEKHDVQEYEKLPLNRDYDGYALIIKNVGIADARGSYKTDIGISIVKPTCNPEDFADDFDDFRVLNIGDLGGANAIRTVDMQGHQLCGDHNDLYIGRKADFAISAPDGTVINVSSLLKSNQH